MRRTLLLLASMTLGVLLACGIALAAEITCPTGVEGRCVGTIEDDTLTGTDERDHMLGLAGIDTIYGKGFPDYAEGGAGKDTLRGEGGRDRLYGDTDDVASLVRGNDRLLGGPSDDDLYGGPGNDRMLGGPGNDEIIYFSGSGSANYDRAHGNDGDDFIYGYEGELYGDGGEDFVTAQGGDATLDGGPGNDQVSPGTCIDEYTQEATGGPGEDFLGVLCTDFSTTGTITYRAVDGERDTINCYEDISETVRADRLDIYQEITFPDGTRIGRQYCDSLTLVE